MSLIQILFFLTTILSFVGHGVASVLFGVLLASGRLTLLVLRLRHN